MKRTNAFRGWAYFRVGWSTYFVFIFAAINTLTVTYYLAIERAPILKEVFPSFASYFIVVLVVGIPLLVIFGYIHYKKSAAYKEEASIHIESNPYMLRVLNNTEILVECNIKLGSIVQKISKNESLTEEETKEITELSKSIEQLTKNRTITNKKDLEFFAEKIDKRYEKKEE